MGVDSIPYPCLLICALLLFMFHEISISWAVRTASSLSSPHTSSPLLQAIPQGNGSFRQMERFTPFTARMHRRAEIKRQETLRYPMAFLNAPLSHFSHLALHKWCLQTMSWEGCIASPSKSLCGILVSQKHDELPVTCPGWLVS